MFKPRGKHARIRARWVGPVYALEAGLAQLYALREGLDVAARQSGGQQ